jgi:hypothetical protein
MRNKWCMPIGPVCPSLLSAMSIHGIILACAVYTRNAIAVFEPMASRQNVHPLHGVRFLCGHPTSVGAAMSVGMSS